MVWPGVSLRSLREGDGRAAATKTREAKATMFLNCILNFDSGRELSNDETWVIEASIDRWLKSEDWNDDDLTKRARRVQYIDW